MPETIWKYPLERAETQTVDVPSGAAPLSVQMQSGTLTLWMRVQAAAATWRYQVRVVGTGHAIPPDAGSYIGSVQEGSFVWHIFGRWF